MTLSVERICNQLNRYELLPPQDIRNLRQRWLRQAGASAGDAVLFGKWLAHHGYITDYQAEVLLRRREDPLVLGRYKLRGRIGRGPMAGVYEGVPPQGQAIAPAGSLPA
jgi:hypothetical protein